MPTIDEIRDFNQNALTILKYNSSDEETKRRTQIMETFLEDDALDEFIINTAAKYSGVSPQGLMFKMAVSTSKEAECIALLERLTHALFAALFETGGSEQQANLVFMNFILSNQSGIAEIVRVEKTGRTIVLFDRVGFSTVKVLDIEHNRIKEEKFSENDKLNYTALANIKMPLSPGLSKIILEFLPALHLFFKENMLCRFKRKENQNETEDFFKSSIKSFNQALGASIPEARLEAVSSTRRGGKVSNLSLLN